MCVESCYYYYTVYYISSRYLWHQLLSCGVFFFPWACSRTRCRRLCYGKCSTYYKCVLIVCVNRQRRELGWWSMIVATGSSRRKFIIISMTMTTIIRNDVFAQVQNVRKNILYLYRLWYVRMFFFSVLFWSPSFRQYSVIANGGLGSALGGSRARYLIYWPTLMMHSDAREQCVRANRCRLHN